MKNETRIRPSVHLVVRGMSWDDKMQWATVTGRWDTIRAEAVEHLNDVTPEGCGISSSDINHVSMGIIEHALADWLMGTPV